MDESAARNKALQCLGQREHSHKELRQKLTSAGCEVAMADCVLKSLAEQGYLDDLRYAEALVSKRQRQGYGPRWIKQELQQSGIDSEIQSNVLDPDTRDWQQTAQQVYRKKYGNRPIADAKEKARRVRFMTGKGFSYDHLRNVLGNVDIPLEEDQEE